MRSSFFMLLQEIFMELYLAEQLYVGEQLCVQRIKKIAQIKVTEFLM